MNLRRPLLVIASLCFNRTTSAVLNSTWEQHLKPHYVSYSTEASQSTFTITPQMKGVNDFFARGGSGRSPGSGEEAGAAGSTDAKCVVFEEPRTGLKGEKIWWRVDMDVSKQMCQKYCQESFDQNLAEDKGANAGCITTGDLKWEQPGGSRRRFALGDCYCNDIFIGKIVDEFVNHAIPAIEEITCKTWYTAIDSVLKVGINAMPGLGQVVGAAATAAIQVAQVAAYTFETEAAAADGFNTWLEDLASVPLESASWPMDKVCGNKFTPAEAQELFSIFNTVASAASGRGLVSGALKAWPPPYPKGRGSKGDMMKFLKSENNKNESTDRGGPDSTTRMPESTSSAISAKGSMDSSRASNSTFTETSMTTMLTTTLRNNHTTSASVSSKP